MKTNSVIQELSLHPIGTVRNIRLWMKRDDLLHPLISGNKWRKLAPIVELAQSDGIKGIISFGGPYSNHLHALAAAGREYNFPTVAIVRGLAADPDNPTLAFARACGMQIIPVSKKAYDEGVNHPDIQQVITRFDGFEVLPEGGASEAAVHNCAFLAEELLSEPIWSRKVYVAVPAGSGCTAAGLIRGLAGRAHTVLFPATASGFTAAHLLRFGVCESSLYTIEKRFDCGGFAAWNTELIAFIRQFKSDEGILLDPLYTGKMMYGLFRMLQEGFFPEGSNVVAIHTGGLQGWDGFRRRFGISWETHTG